MTGIPTFATPPSFLGILRTDPDSALCIAGIPLDIGTTNRAGARFGPHAVRHASRMLVDGDHPVHRIDPARFPIADIGDIEIALGDLLASIERIEARAAGVRHLAAIGGEHTITLPLLRALAKRTGPLALVHFDAHVDTWPDSFGQTNGHGSVFFHAINEGIIEPRRTIQVGIRSPVANDIMDWTLAKGVTIVPPSEVYEDGVAATVAKIEAVVGSAPAYLTFDVDALDPAFAPGTGTPEIGGLTNWQAQAILRRLGGIAFAGMDVVEVAPAYDVAEITALAAATILWEYLCLVAPHSS